MAVVNPQSTTQPTLPHNLPAISIKLDGTNYYLWKGMLTSLLRSYKLLGYAEGTIPAPSSTISVPDGSKDTTVSNPDYEQWQVYDQFCLTCLYVSVNPDIGSQLVGLNSAAEAWNKLKTLFDSQSLHT